MMNQTLTTMACGMTAVLLSCAWTTAAAAEPQSGGTDATLSFNAVDACLNAGQNQLVVDVDLTDAQVPVVGAQLFLIYDNAVLDFVSADPGDQPFNEEIYEFVNETTGDIIYAVGDPTMNNPTQSDTRVATLTFNILEEVCGAEDLLTFISGPPPTTYLTDDQGLQIDPQLNDLGAVTIDQTLPAITCPPPVAIECDDSTDPSATGMATALDSCDPDVDVTYVDDDSGLSLCNGTGFIVRTWTATDDCGNSVSCDQTIVVADFTAPVISDCPGDITTDADAGGCDAVVTWTEPTATDNCGPATLVFQSHEPGDSFAPGTTTVTYIFEDDCGDESVCEFDVTVSGFNQLAVDVELQAVVHPGPFTRCITFELTSADCNTVVTVEEEMTFVNGMASGTVLVPCGDYACITARDQLHTLARTIDPLMTSGTDYIAGFTSSDGSELIGGNLDDNEYIDILDFGVFAGEFGTIYGSGNTNCAAGAPNADVNGDGVVGTADFSFIQINFLTFADAPCCVPLQAGGIWNDRPGARGQDQPITQISVKELHRRGLGELRVADLNNDGWLDQKDVAAFAAGARP